MRAAATAFLAGLCIIGAAWVISELLRLFFAMVAHG